ncbi:aqualysin-1-like [Saccoglossus kowalevskii]|uniref:Cuticle-degrading protease-like n=1 Tax=Saccoglossus kowalevskii TaxID=10224 RepID=A0ABM0MEE6_SACKO|nr:PREDICTED: cuticle-degrading protease-like [Saccoglossus kowalevskii]
MLFSILFVVIPIGVYCQIDPSLTECGMVPLYHGDIPDEYAVIFTEDFTHPQVEDILAPIVGDGFEIDTIYCNFRNSWAVVTVTDVDRMEMVRLLPTVLFVQGVYRLTVSENWGQDRINQRETTLDGNSTISRCQVTKICPATESPNIYILDTGIRYSHEEFGGRAAFAYDFLASEKQNGFDTHGHGTKVAAVAAGKTLRPRQECLYMECSNI